MSSEINTSGRVAEVRQRLRDIRHEKGITQKTVEQKTKIKQSLLSAYESGSRELGLGDILALCEAYECSLAFILGEDKAQPYDADKKTDLSEAADIEQLLAAPLDESEKKLCDTYIKLHIYKVLRELYCANPRHKNTRLFKLSEEQLDAALRRSQSDLENMLPGALSRKKACAKSIELEPEMSAALRAFVGEVEQTASHVPDTL
ncbi:helix-turn-helix transcriptional regulator [Ruminococcus sp. NK3A76]|uniref:helix-turn-helix domain-containing protein n=1 Tax=Ruminococcus sp. NK3A76 TaxID=877411 RepID=UPI00048C5925|nr:helix-turn-helix transcriptional regulator [Ruminococcus sp. NK3A76]